jgi:hypothetical protein
VHGFTTSLGVKFYHSFSSQWWICFVSLGCNANCSRVGMFLAMFWPSPELSFVMALPLLS